MSLRGLGVALLLWIGLACSAVAQVDTGTITGRVIDPSGSVIPGVRISLLQPETNFRFQALTNTEGIFRIQSLQPGTYQITFEAGGFKRLVQDNIVLQTGAVTPVDARLEIGSTSESVQVTAEASLLETETSSTGTVTEGDVLYKLPLFQRNITNSMVVMPGLTVQTTGGSGGVGAYTVGGQRNSGIALFEDGVYGNDPVVSTLGAIRPIENAVEEVKVLTGTLPAEYGHTTGGVLTVVKKSGTNQLHGMASDYGRTRIMAHRQFFNLYASSQPQPGNPNGVPGWFMMPDANVGGPLVIPKIYNGRNKTFFFFSYEKLIEKKTQAYTSQTPTPDELAGDFTFGGLGQKLYDPYSTRRLADGTWTRDPFPTNIIPRSMFDPVAAKILSYNIWNPPNMPGSFSSTGPVSNYTYDPPSRTFQEFYSGRVDHQFNLKNKIYGSYTYNHGNGLQRPTSIPRSNSVFDGTTGYNTPSTSQNYSVGATTIFSPTSVNDARVGFYRSRNDMFVPSFNQNWGQQLGIPNISPALMPAFSSSGLSSGTYTTAPGYTQLYGLTVAGPSQYIRQNLSFRDDFSKNLGTHALKMGYEILNAQANYYQLGQPSGVFQFDNMTAGLQPNGQPIPNTGNTFAGFELGAVRQANFSTYTTTWLPRDRIQSLYVQDDWKFSPNVTFNLGLRWSTESPFQTAHGLESQFSPTTVDSLTGKMGAIIHPTGGLNSRDLRNFQPRFGAAWHVRDKWVLRGGFGINTVDLRWKNALQQFDEYQALNVQQRAPGDPTPLFRLSQGPAPVVYNVLPNGSAAYVGTNYGSRNVTWLDPNLHPGYVMNWNATLEYQFSARNLLKLYYQGSAGVGLAESWNVNAFPTSFGQGDPALQQAAFAATQNYLPYPQFGTINFLSNTGHSTYHAATVQFRKLYSHGLVLDTFYTFSKVLDDCDTDYGVCTGVEPVSNRNLNKGRAGFDMNHRWVASFTYEVPIGKGRRFMNRGGILNMLFGGYEIAWIQTAESGNPVGFSFVNSPYNYYPTSIGNWVPNVVTKPTMPEFGLGSKIGPNRFNQALSNAVVDFNDFAAPPPFTPGNAGRNIMTGPGAFYSMVSAKKNFRITERFNLQFRWDFQNAFHNYAFSPPSTQVDFKNPQLFGKITSDVATANIQGEPLMNLQLRLSW